MKVLLSIIAKSNGWYIIEQTSLRNAARIAQVHN